MKATDWFKNLFVRAQPKPEKIRLRVKNDKLVLTYYPAYIAIDPMRYAAARQFVVCYEMQLSGASIMPGLRLPPRKSISND